MALNTKPHLLLKNQFVSTSKFNIQRGINDDSIVSIDRDPIIYARQKEYFRVYKEQVINDRLQRVQNRTLIIPSFVEYIKIYFLKDFDNSLRTYFENTFGLVPVFYEDLNQTITLAIDDNEKINVFFNELDLFINSGDHIQPHGKSYAILINISEFEFLSSEKITRSPKNGNIIIQLVDGLRIVGKFRQIQESLTSFLVEKKYEWKYLYNDIIEIKGISEQDYELLVDNFDIIEAVTSFKIFNRYSGVYGERLVSQYRINIDREAPLVGVIDTGVTMTQLLKDVVVDMGLDITDKEDPKTFFDDCGHGTAMAGLVAYGKQLYSENDELINDARIVPIKVMGNEEDTFSISDLIEAIRIAYSNGVRIFSLSINSIVIKQYNENISHYAFLLDKLSFELDILIFISTGNLDREHVSDFYEKNNFEYPKHFFNPNCNEHEEELYNCSETNICPPADSMNNMTVGAIAENFEEGMCDVSLDKSLPAYYSKKWHISANFPVNGSYRVKKSQYNNNIFKPDILNAGGDMLSDFSAMKVISNDFTEPYSSRAGSSLSAPLTANLAAKIIKRYPTLRMQTVKALIINSAEKINLRNINEFKDLILDIKKRHSVELIGKTFNNFEELDRKEKQKLSNAYSIKNLEKSLTGFGVPKDDYALASTLNRVTLVIEESVNVENYHGFYVNLPEYIRELAANTSSGVIKISVTLTYSFEPTYANSLAYNPLHISFNVLNDIDRSLQQTLDLISDRSNGHKSAYYKSGGLKWSDDFFPLNSKPFSNSQKIIRNISKRDLLKLIDNFVVVVRCNAKSDALGTEEAVRLRSRAHNFSMIITLEELNRDENTTGNLYDEIINKNTVEAIIELDTDLDLTLG